ncbi:MAG: hypothetical protein M3P37_11170 [Actinomycetota bacterium]|nr:hypothetical protein [Actinomycetota bacterium]
MSARKTSRRRPAPLPAAAAYLDLGKGQLGLEHEGVGAAVDDTDVVPPHLEARDGESVVEPGGELQPHPHTACLAAHEAEQLVVGVGAGGVGCASADRHAVDHHDLVLLVLKRVSSTFVPGR